MAIILASGDGATRSIRPHHRTIMSGEWKKLHENQRLAGRADQSAPMAARLAGNVLCWQDQPEIRRPGRAGGFRKPLFCWRYRIDGWRTPGTSGWPRSNPSGRQARPRQTTIGPTDAGRKWQAAPEHLHSNQARQHAAALRPQSGSAPDVGVPGDTGWYERRQTTASNAQTPRSNVVLTPFLA